LESQLNIIINCAGSVDFGTRLDQAVRINVTGPLLLLKLAENCKNFLGFCHLSSCYAISDRQGFVEERLYESSINWESAYKQITAMTLVDIV
jgi:hypothetical protein